MARFHESLTVSVVILFGAVMNVIIGAEGSLENDYYVGLVQAAVILSFLLRVGLRPSVGALFLLLSGFALAAVQSPDEKEITLQIVVLATMFLTCAFGIYFIERYRRTAYLQAKTIEVQNAQLAGMLEAAEADNRRKIAAMNTLVHFVRTPVHQIVGFTDVVVAELQAAGDAARESLEHAERIRSAAGELSNNVARLLTSHRLDEAHLSPPERIGLRDLFDDLRYELEDAYETVDAPTSAAGALLNHRSALTTAVEALGAFFKERAREAGPARKVAIAFAIDDRGVLLTLADDGQAMSAEDFAGAAAPLTALSDYLSMTGSRMPMALRTAVRAIEVCGGHLVQAPEPPAGGGLAVEAFIPNLPPATDDPEAAARDSDEAGESGKVRGGRAADAA